MMARGLMRVIGIRLPKQMAVAFKKEAAAGMCTSTSFQEMWKLYWQMKREDQVKKSK